MIPYMVGKLAPISSHFTRGLVKYVPGRSYFRAVSYQNGNKYVTSPPPPIVELVLSLLFDDVLFCLPFCWCPCMAINVSVQYDGGFLPDIILLTQCYYHRGTRLNAMKRFCIFSY